MNENPDIPARTSDSLPSRGYNIQNLLILGLGAAGLFLCYQLAVPFLTPLTVAFVLAVLFEPFHRWISTHIKTPSLAAIVSVLTIAGAVFVMLALLLTQLVREAAVGADLVRKSLDDGLLQKLSAAHTKAAPLLRTAFDHINVS